ncbi:MAG TPA: S1C family serine protease, partial [Terriglobales bacterium]
MSRSIGLALIALLFFPLLAPAQTALPSSADVIEKVSPAIATVLAGKLPTEADSFGSAVVVRENGILLAPYHVVKDAKAVQIRFKNGEVFDEVQLLGVDTRRDVAALRITASALPLLPIGSAAKAKSGDSVFVVSNPSAKAWSADLGTVNAYRLSDGVPGAGTGYRVLQLSAPAFSANDGLVVDDQGRALALVVRANSGEMLYAVPLENVLGLTEVPVKFSYVSGVALQPPGSSQPHSEPSYAA